MIFRLIGSLAILLALVVTPATAQDLKIGVVDFQRVVNESARGQEAKELLTKEGEYKSKKLRETEEGLKKQMEELGKQRTVLSPEAFEQRQQQVLEERNRFSESVQSFQMELRRKEAELTQDILEDVQGVITELAKKEGITLVIEKSAGVLYALDKYDLTDRVIQRYNKKSAPAKKK